MQVALRTLAEIASDRTDLEPGAIAHCESLVRDLGLLADLAFSDLILWLPVWNQGGFVAAAQVRRVDGGHALPQRPRGARSTPGVAGPSWTGRGRRPGLGQVVPRTDPLLPGRRRGGRGGADSQRSVDRGPDPVSCPGDPGVGHPRARLPARRGRPLLDDPVGGVPLPRGLGLHRGRTPGRRWPDPPRRLGGRRVRQPQCVVGIPPPRAGHRPDRGAPSGSSAGGSPTAGGPWTPVSRSCAAAGCPVREIASDSATVTVRALPMRGPAGQRDSPGPRAGRHGAAPPRAGAAEQGRDDPRDPPPGQEQPADRRRAAAVAGPPPDQPPRRATR